MLRTGAINQGVFTEDSLAANRFHRVETYMDRWNCRRMYTRDKLLLGAFMEHLESQLRQDTIRELK
ncbi:unnamed protein product [Choristocarpus tenellus]